MDHGKIITEFERQFKNVDHEVIKIILQACKWDKNKAHKALVDLAGESLNTESSSPPCGSTAETFAKVLSQNRPSTPKNITKSIENKGKMKSMISTKIEKIKKLIAKKNKILIIMRGLPGSGKSSLAHELNKNGEVLSTDDYFYDKFNNYNFNPNILSEAHNWNKDRTRLKMFNSVSPIFIDNTNLQVWEFEPYVKLGLINNYHVEILEPETPWKYNCKELSIRCIHGVPQKKIEDMKERFDTNVTISYIIKNIKRSNALPFNFKKPETMSHANEDEPDVIIESSSSEEDVTSMGLDSMTSINSSEDKLNSNDNVLDNDMSGEEFLQMVDQFGKLLKKNIKKKDQGFEENTHKSESNDPVSEDEAMYKFCSDMEDKFGVPVSLLSLKKDGEGNSSKTLNNCLDLKVTKTVVTEDKESSNDIEEWDCVSVPVASWDSEDKKSPEENNKSMASKLPRIKKREENSLKLINDYYHNSDEEKEDPSISSWVPEESSLNSWIMETANDSIPPPKFAHTGAIPKISKSSQNFTSPTENIREVKHSLTTTPLLQDEKSTQYCTSDYSCSNNFLKLLDCNSVSFIPAMPKKIENNSPLTKLKLLIDKSTMTCDLSSIVADSHCALKKLVSFFPDIPSIDLHDVLEKCSYDLDWAMNLLIDGGYKLADPLDYEQFSDHEIENEFTKDLSVNTETFINEKYDVSVEHPNSSLEAKSLKISNKRKFVRSNNLKIKNDIENCFFPPKNLDVKLPRRMKNEYDNQNLNKLENANKEDGPSESKLDSGSDSEDGIEKSSHYLTMELDPSFASRLINIFGPISSLNLSSGFTKADQTVILPLELCHQIHKYWGKTLEGKFQHEENVLDRCIKEDEELARRLQEEEDAKVNCDAFDIDPPKSFQEIVDLEKALNQSNTLAKSSNDNTCSSILTLQKLQEEFSHVDSDAVEQEFFEQGLDYNSTKSLLSYKYGKSKSVPKVVLAPGMTSEPTEEETKSSDSEEENWEEDISIDVLDPQMYRDEAQTHYLERKKALQKAQEASKNGMKSVASYYAQIGNLHTQKFKEANERASKKILSAVNSDKGPNTLDLHLLHVGEALQVVQKYLFDSKIALSQKSNKSLTVTIITGKGNHSVGGEARLKPAIGYFLRKEGYSVQEFSGLFKVFLKSPTSS